MTGREYFIHFFRILLGLVFIVSGSLKLYPVEPFELNFIDLGVANWYTAPFIARLLVGIELLLGLFLIFNFFLKTFTLKATIFLLFFFTIYLLIQIIREGNSGNCGCFGTYLQMTPAESIFKNIVLISIAIIVYRLHQINSSRLQRIWPFFLLAAFIAPFVLNPIDLMAANYRQPEVTNFPFESELLYNDTITHKPQIDISKGKHIVAFFSMTCSHCRTSAFKMHVIEKRHPEIPFFMVLNGKESSLTSFLDETKSSNIPYMILHGMPFAKITGGSVPTIYWIKDGIVVKKSNYISLEEADILEWLKK
jgi:uncharacterized membrane protein YphA (DoxX/SURF4 family)